MFRKIHKLSGDGGRRPAVLLLSATPYRTYATRWEEDYDTAHVQLYELVEFLVGVENGCRARAEAERLFHELGECLHEIPRLEFDMRLSIIARRIANDTGPMPLV